MAPALLIYTLYLYPLGKVGWLAAFAYSACTALRLARFNLESVQDKRFFYGLPTPAAAGILATWVWLNPTNLWLHQHPWLLALAAVTLGGLKVSTFPFHSFKTLKIHDSVPFIMILAVMALFLLIIYKPPLMLLLLFVLYACHGPILYLFLLLKKRSEKTTKADTRP
jgi:CDP-diacylglycerol--serine O-phosphatidyltransferase